MEKFNHVDITALFGDLCFEDFRQRKSGVGQLGHWVKGSGLLKGTKWHLNL